MLNQIIYTRCSPHRDLRNQGQVVRGDGFGVFSMSQELFADPRLDSFDFLQARLAVQNGAKETSPTGLFNSYEYTAIAPEVYAYSYEVARPLCKTPRKNGQGHRTGTYIKQCLVGEIRGYPCEWFGASVWNACKKSENDYYLDGDPAAAPPLLPCVSDMAENGYIHRALIQKFVSDGRASAVKAAIWFLLHEFDKPENERKVLLIKDVPENVERWIAAIEYGFSSEMARKITFTTNRSKLGTQTDSALFYYTDEAGRFQPMMNRSMPQTRHPYCMIVGYHPKDNFCAALKPMAASNFVLLDGMAKTIDVRPDGSIRMPYYDAVVSYGSDIQDFCSQVLPCIPAADLTGCLPELFDAYKYLLDADHRADTWKYTGTVDAFRTLLKFGLLTKARYHEYLLDECLSVYPHFANEDESCQYQLLRILWNIARTRGREREITGCIADRLVVELESLPGNGAALTKTWNAVKAADIMPIVRPALKELLNDVELMNYASQFQRSDVGAIGTVSDMFFCMLDAERVGVRAIEESKEKFNFTCMAMIGMLDDPKRLSEVLKRLAGARALFDRLTLAVAEYLERSMPDKTELWWDMVIEASGGNVIELCRNLSRSRSATIDFIERLLANWIYRTGKCDRDTLTAFVSSTDRMGCKKQTGRIFFDTWIKAASPNEFAHIIHGIKRCALQPSVEQELFRTMDASLPFEESGVNPAVYQEIEQWAGGMGMESRSAAFFEFGRSFEKEKNPERAIELANSFADKRYTISDRFAQSGYFKSLASKAADLCSPRLHLVMLCLYNIPDPARQERFVDAYVLELLACTKSRHLADELISICEASISRDMVPGRDIRYVRDIQGMLEAALCKRLVQYYKPNLIEQVARSQRCRPEVKERLISMLRDAGQKAAPRGIGGIINNLFGRR